VLLDLVKWTATLSWVSPHVATGVGAIYFVFLIGGLALWYFVGRALDDLISSKTPAQRTLTAGRVLLNLFALACGIRLVFSAFQYLLPEYSKQHVSVERTVEGVIVLLWSLVLLVFPIAKLAKSFRRGPAGPPVPDEA
jgi:hypothetical protein